MVPSLDKSTPALEATTKRFGGVLGRGRAAAHPGPLRSLVTSGVRRSFSGSKMALVKADDDAGLSPGEEDNAGRGYFRPEKPRGLLSSEGIILS